MPVWKMPGPLTSVGTARNLRVAYLIDSANSPAALLDSIFEEAYCRWGGRRTLIVPAEPDGIDPRYRDWLYFFDADVIYSFVNLTDDAVASIHERYSPAFLERHDPRRYEEGHSRYFTPRLPITGLSCLTVIPAFLSTRQSIFERIDRLSLLDRYWDNSDSEFLKENFGFLSDAFGSGVISEILSDYFDCYTLISEDSLTDSRLGKISNHKYEINENIIIKDLGQNKSIISIAQLSDFYYPKMTIQGDYRSDGFSLVAGNSLDDRLLFWNGHHRYYDTTLGDITRADSHQSGS